MSQGRTQSETTDGFRRSLGANDRANALLLNRLSFNRRTSLFPHTWGCRLRQKIRGNLEAQTIREVAPCGGVSRSRKYLTKQGQGHIKSTWLVRESTALEAVHMTDCVMLNHK